MRRWYFASFAAARLPCCACTRSNEGFVVLASVATPQSMPITALEAGSGPDSGRVTTKLAYQCPSESRYTRTLDGADGSSRDHTTGITTPPGNRKRPSPESEKPRRV